MPLDAEQLSEVRAAITEALDAARPEIVKAAAEAGAKGVADAVAQAIAPVTDRLAKLEAPTAEDQGGDAPTALTMEDLERVLADRDAKRGEAATKAAGDAAAAQARDDYAAEHMKDLPAAYHGLLPATDDAEALKAAEQKVRQQAAADAKAAGWKVPDVGSKPPGGSGPGDAQPDTSKMSPTAALKLAYEAEAAGDGT